MVPSGTPPRQSSPSRAMREPNMTDAANQRTLAAGRLFYALGTVGIGGQHFYNGDFVQVILPSFPPWMPGQYFWVCVAGIGLVFTGGAVVIGMAARAAAILLGSVLLAVLLLRDIPWQLATGPGSIGAWTNCFKALTLSGGAFAVAAALPRQGTARWDRYFVAFGCAAMAVTVATFGVDHFVYAAFVASLVPDWIPGHAFWTYFCGAALIAAGAGMILRIKARLAAGLLAAMIFAWLVLLHIPRALADPHGANGNEWTSAFEALSFTGIALILSRLLPGKPPPAPGVRQVEGS
jgi:uncharacterized membrane protein